MNFDFYPGIEAKRKQMKGKQKDKAPLFGKEAWQCCMHNWETFSEAELRRIDAESVNAPFIGPAGFRYSANSYITEDAVVVMNPHFTAIPIRDIIWIYGSTVKNSVNFIPTSKDIRLNLVARDNCSYVMLMTILTAISKKNPCQDAINTIRAKLIGKRPGIIYGYSDEIQKMRTFNFNGLVQYVDAHSVK